MSWHTPTPSAGHKARNGRAITPAQASAWQALTDRINALPRSAKASRSVLIDRRAAILRRPA